MAAFVYHPECIKQHMITLLSNSYPFLIHKVFFFVWKTKEKETE